MRFDSRVIPSKLEVVSPEQVSPISVVLRNVSHDSATNSVSYEIAFEGPADLMKSIQEQQFINGKLWPAGYVYLYDVASDGTQQWSEISRVGVTAGAPLVLTADHSRAAFVTGRMTSKLQSKNSAATWISVAAEFLGNDGKQWVLSVRADSVFQVR
jgi:hypothetical protein